jgi:hypothetical protein
MNAAIAQGRLRNQLVTGAGSRRPADVVGWFGAMQAQEYRVAKWAIALRMRHDVVEAEIERAFAQGRILRTHVMRPTWHFVIPSDIRWLLALTAPRVQRVMSTYNRRLELDARTLARGVGVIERALGDGRYLTRTELGGRLQRVGLAMAGQRLAHLMMHAELEAVVCSGPRRGKQFTYALIAERAPGAPTLSRDEALATLIRRFYRSHGPATIRDFVWWSGLTVADAKRGLEMNKAARADVGDRTYWTVGSERREGTRGDLVHLLPIYDEYLVAYRDRDVVPHWPSARSSAPRGSVTFQHALVIDGQVAGTWRIKRDSPAITIDVVPLRPITKPERRAVAAGVERFERFLDAPVNWSFV